MKWSMFIYKVFKNNKILLYNTLNHAIVILNNDELKKINNDLPTTLINKVTNNLIQMEFLIDKNINEKKKFISLLLKEWNNSRFLGLHFLATTGCNFKCPYCYQLGIHNSSLNKKNIEKIIDYIEDYIVKNKIKESTVEITGGEPTTNWPNVKILLKKINKVFKQNKVKYKVFLTTNGFNFNKEKIDFITKYNFKRLQITLDGPEQIHNQRRMLYNNEGTFKKIIDNLDYIFANKKIKKLNLRINYDLNNVNAIPELLKYIKKRFNIKKITLSFGLITKTINTSKANKYINIHGIKESEFLNYYIKLYKTAYDLGYKMPNMFSFDGMCTAKLKHSMVIEPNGNLGKCISGVGRESFKIGNILTKKIKKLNYLFLDNYEKGLTKKCAFLPLCHTGCRFESFILNNNIKSIYCKKELLEKINKEILIINYFKEKRN